MRAKTRCAAALCLLLAAGTALSQGTPANAAPEKWEAAPAAEATELAARCMGMPEAEVRRMISDAGTNALVTRRAGDRTKPYIVASGRRVVCVQVSEKGYPRVPQEVFDKTIQFEGMAAQQVAALRSALSAQLALRGVATALVKNDKGNAVQVTYLFPSETPSRMYYQASFMKQGEFDESRYEAVFSAPGNMTVTARGQPAERFRSLYEVSP